MKLLRPQEVCEMLGIVNSTLMLWEQRGWITPCARTGGNHRRYFLSDVEGLLRYKENGLLNGFNFLFQYDNLEKLPDRIKIYGYDRVDPNLQNELDQSSVFTIGKFMKIDMPAAFTLTISHRQFFLEHCNNISSGGIYRCDMKNTHKAKYEFHDGILHLNMKNLWPEDRIYMCDQLTEKLPSSLFGQECIKGIDGSIIRYVEYKKVEYL